MSTSENLKAGRMQENAVTGSRGMGKQKTHIFSLNEKISDLPGAGVAAMPAGGM